MSLVKLSNNGVKNVSSLSGLTSSVGDLVFISKQTASSSASISFTSGIDSTYKEYVFYFKDIHPSGGGFFTVGFRDGGTDYDAVKTTTSFRAIHREDNASANLAYDGDDDLAQSTSFQRLTNGLTTDNDGSATGIMHLFNPSSTTFVKHFISRSSAMVSGGSNYAWDEFIAGYCNTTTAIDGVQFKMSTGNIDAGDILLYGVN